ADRAEYLGEAEMVSAEAEKNVSVAAEAKTDARNKAIELLDDIIANSSADEKAKASALEQKTKIAQNMEKESICEGIINSKGVGEAVVYIADDSAVVTVKNDKLSKEDVAKITDVILSNTDITVEKIKVSKMQ
ncbi:MAG: SpoIIIAH-like family protein, partial [Clostridia bacterium]|nr:SpoIIIAH-like family protein [Clostridia bacterium]